MSEKKPFNTLQVRKPSDNKYLPWMARELPNYQSACDYIAFFFEQRASMGDMETTDLWAELKQNVCIIMRDGHQSDDLQ